MSEERVLLLTESTRWGDMARDLLTVAGAGVEHVPWSWGESRAELDTAMTAWRGDYVICFKADCIVPKATLASSRVAINFHPGPPWLRGVACPERAVKRGDLSYGVTCHHMIEEVDAGKIVVIDTFEVPPCGTVAALRERVGLSMLSQLERVWLSRHTLAEPGDARDPIWASELLSVRRARREGLL